jgi:hypothetical protein
MIIKTKSKSEAEKIFRNIQILPYEKFVDIRIDYPRGYFAIVNKRNSNNTFIPFSFRYLNNGNEIEIENP